MRVLAPYFGVVLMFVAMVYAGDDPRNCDSNCEQDKVNYICGVSVFDYLNTKWFNNACDMKRYNCNYEYDQFKASLNAKHCGPPPALKNEQFP